MIRILFFGPVAEQVGARELAVDFHAGMRLQDVVAQMETRYAQAFKSVSFIAVNNAQTQDTQMALNDGDEIAFMSKFSGG
jgi:molybdopterin synthase sulfur carrier subunit